MPVCPPPGWLGSVCPGGSGTGLQSHARCVCQALLGNYVLAGVHKGRYVCLSNSVPVIGHVVLSWAGQAWAGIGSSSIGQSLWVGQACHAIIRHKG